MNNSIAIIIDDMSSGGAQRVIAHLAPAWVAHGRGVELLTLDSSESDFYPLPADIARVVVGGVGASSNPLAAIAANARRIMRLRRALRASKAPVVLAFMTPTNVLTILAGLGLGKRIIVSERNDPARQDPGRFWRTLRRWSYRWASVVTANSDHALALMKEYVPERKLAAVPNPVHLPRDHATPATSTSMLNVGRLVPQKGQALILAAFAKAASDRGDWRLTILGDGSCRQPLTEQIAQLHLQTRCDLPGVVADPSGHYRSAGIFVLASHYEGTPNTLLEAMAHGIPCIVPDCLPGALEHAVDGTTGLVYRAGDIEDLARSMALLMDDPALRTRIGTAARERMAELSLPRIIERWDEVLFRRPGICSPVKAKS